MTEERKTERLKDINEIIISVVSGENNHPKEEIFYSHSKDISVCGARIRINTILPVGTYLNVDFTLKDLQQKITTFGKVKWIKSIIADMYYEAGVEFISTSSEVIKKLEDYISWKQNSISLKPI